MLRAHIATLHKVNSAARKERRRRRRRSRSRIRKRAFASLEAQQQRRRERRALNYIFNCDILLVARPPALRARKQKRCRQAAAHSLEKERERKIYKKNRSSIRVFAQYYYSECVARSEYLRYIRNRDQRHASVLRSGVPAEPINFVVKLFSPLSFSSGISVAANAYLSLSIHVPRGDLHEYIINRASERAPGLHCTTSAYAYMLTLRSSYHDTRAACATTIIMPRSGDSTTSRIVGGGIKVPHERAKCRPVIFSPSLSHSREEKVESMSCTTSSKSEKCIRKSVAVHNRPRLHRIHATTSSCTMIVVVCVYNFFFLFNVFSFRSVADAIAKIVRSISLNAACARVQQPQREKSSGGATRRSRISSKIIFKRRITHYAERNLKSSFRYQSKAGQLISALGMSNYLRSFRSIRSLRRISGTTLSKAPFISRKRAQRLSFLKNACWIDDISKSGDVSMVEPLLKAGADPNLPDIKGTTPLHIICNYHRDEDDLALTLFELSDAKYQPLRVDSQDRLGRTPLHEALYNGHKKVAALLLKRGADATVAQSDGTTALHIVAKLSRDDEVDYNVDSLIEIIIKNYLPERFRRSMRVDGPDNLGNTPLHYALENLHLKLSVWLLSRNADFNAANERGTTPLHVMCDRMLDDSDDYLDEFFECAGRQKQRRVLIDARDSWGRTPLQLAVANLLPKAVKILLDHGADLSSFVFPDGSYFALRIDPQDEFFLDIKVELAARALTVVELLEKNGYELSSSEVQLTVMGFFATHGLFEEPEDGEEFWYHDEEFAEAAKKIMMTEKDSSPSLYHLILMGPKEAKKALTYWDYYDSRRNYQYQGRALRQKKLLCSLCRLLDEWVPEDCLDTRKVQFPRRDGATAPGTGAGTGAATPKKQVPSRPASPSVVHSEPVNGSAVLQAAIQKKMSRKRKATVMENDDSQEGAQQATPGGPRPTGSLVAHHHEDVVTRMKNIELIELGRHRIKPWDIIDQHQTAMARRKLKIDPKCLHWTPKDWSIRAKCHRRSSPGSSRDSDRPRGSRRHCDRCPSSPGTSTSRVFVRALSISTAGRSATQDKKKLAFNSIII
ncbi:unnamed protein product [Trichogramma brassicae]|uniref:Uncharacterized protein n=1 Tax=Trichogramma brassicae TaxID=86971 RepID=A0A6H5I8J6_9HYME|nr:unnamed protein product [Trichogramma brassicae]